MKSSKKTADTLQEGIPMHPGMKLSEQGGVTTKSVNQGMVSSGASPTGSVCKIELVPETGSSFC